MLFSLVPSVRAGIMAMGLAGFASISAMAAPVVILGASSEPAGTIQVQGQGRYSDCQIGGDCFRPRGYTREWEAQRIRHNWDRKWRHPRDHWDDNPPYYRDQWPDYYAPPYYGSGIYFNYYAPRYRYYEPPRRYAPVRRIYRGASAHVRWCQARYRTYRAWDNTYKPNRHTRRQCISPYS